MYVVNFSNELSLGLKQIEEDGEALLEVYEIGLLDDEEYIGTLGTTKGATDISGWASQEVIKFVSALGEDTELYEDVLSVLHDKASSL